MEKKRREEEKELTHRYLHVVYTEETRALLAKYDELLNTLRAGYERAYPYPSEQLRHMLGEKWYGEQCYNVAHKRRSMLLAEPIYQACMKAQAKIIMMSPCTYYFSIDTTERRTT